ncbi:TPA: hypothetical protein P2K63_004368 [Aeromonas salmonicida]|uniref:hypothetical protein n=1 Tax=Aeromonas salmonicida TaxID=645 RepID=UPI0015E7F851|nr:hypothetical protein [Aeromonas salmonicida]BCT99827.1 hypothetical protein [uncultured bacterium]HDN9415723.1 hypothetical protein [Aeromonas salmonicida]HDN9424841.1 hypothetical protein [Aeromonas salmonicida]HDN9429221.1 hypothetical protein [Aeromonas salmonicida]HDN9433609.1 hypothetical protein [Aeromonas salmonicida]
MHKMLEPQEWMRQSLDAGALALRAVIDGRALPVDDLIAGTMAVELLTTPGRYASPFDLYDILHRARLLLNVPAFARQPEGRAEAGRLLPMFERIRADQ